MTVSKGSDVSLRCSCGIPNTPIVWNMHNQTVRCTMDHMINLTNVNMLEKGNYQCSASIGNVAIKSNLASIAVFGMSIVRKVCIVGILQFVNLLGDILNQITSIYIRISMCYA